MSNIISKTKPATTATTTTEPEEEEEDPSVPEEQSIDRSWGHLLPGSERKTIFATARTYHRDRLINPDRYPSFHIGLRRREDRLSKEDRQAVLALFVECLGTVIQGSSFSLGPKPRPPKPPTAKSKPAKKNNDCTIDLEPEPEPLEEEPQSEEPKDEDEPEPCPQISPMSITEALSYFQEKILPQLKKISCKLAGEAPIFFHRAIVQVLNPKEKACEFSGSLSRVWCQCKLVRWGRGMDVAVTNAYFGEKMKDCKTAGKAVIRKFFIRDTKFLKRLNELQEEREMAKWQHKKMKREASKRRLQKIRKLSLENSPIKKAKWMKDRLVVPVKGKKGAMRLSIIRVDPGSLIPYPDDDPEEEEAVAIEEDESMQVECPQQGCNNENEVNVVPPPDMPRLELVVMSPPASPLPEPRMPILQKVMESGENESVMILDYSFTSSSSLSASPSSSQISKEGASSGRR